MTFNYAKRWVLTRLSTSQGKHLENVQNMRLCEFGQRQRLGADAPREVGRRKLRFEICELTKNDERSTVHSFGNGASCIWSASLKTSCSKYGAA